MRAKEFLSELSTEKLAQYKKASYVDARKADAEGDYKRGDKRFKGINKATIKQFDNDLKKHNQQGVAEAATDDPKFQKMMGNIQKTTPDPFSGYVAVSYASEKPSKKIKGATVNGKPVPTTTDDPGQLINDLKFTSDRIEQQLMAIGKKHGWDLIDPGQGQGYSELYFDTNREYTTNTQRQLATNIVKTVNEINKFFASMNRSLQATGLPVYQVNVWQGLGANGNINQIDDINQITNIAQGKDAKADPGPAIGHIILKYIPGYEAENDELGYDLEDFANAKKVASIYIAKGEQAGLQAQHRLDDHVSNMIDELLSDHNGNSLRTIWDLDEQGVAVGSLKEFAPGSGGGESGRWYTDDEMTDIVGDGWWQDMDVSGANIGVIDSEVPKEYMIQQAQAWLDDQGYSVEVLNCRVNDDDMEWYIEGSFHNPGFAKKGVAEGSLEELANTSLKVKEPKDFVNHNDRKQVTYKVMKFKSGKDTYLINFTVKGAPAFGKKSNWNAVNVAFGVREEPDDYSFGDEINTNLTAKNKNQFLIYSTVINAVRKFITEYNTEIDEIIMQGAGQRQEAMYQRFFQVAPKYFPGWHHNGKHSLVRDVPRPTGKKVREQGVAEGCSFCGGKDHTALDEEGKASRSLCTSGRPDSDLGASQLASCKSQGLRARDGEKSHKLGKSPKSRVTVGGHRIKGRKYGGPLPDYGSGS